MGIAAIGIHHPLLAPGRRQFDRAAADRDDFQAEPLMKRAARYQLLYVFDAGDFTHQTKPLLGPRLLYRENRFAGRESKTHFAALPAAKARRGDRTNQGTTTTLPMTSRSLMRRKPSAA